jgi:hypothetical protein
VDIAVSGISSFSGAGRATGVGRGDDGAHLLLWTPPPHLSEQRPYADHVESTQSIRYLNWLQVRIWTLVGQALPLWPA